MKIINYTFSNSRPCLSAEGMAYIASFGGRHSYRSYIQHLATLSCYCPIACAKKGHWEMLALLKQTWHI